jgi:hypothetical protein
VELAMAPDRSSEILARYHVTAELKVRADNYWKAKMDEEPETRKAWEHAYGVYRTWLMQTMGRQR